MDGIVPRTSTHFHAASTLSQLLPLTSTKTSLKRYVPKQSQKRPCSRKTSNTYNCSKRNKFCFVKDPTKNNPGGKEKHNVPTWSWRVPFEVSPAAPLGTLEPPRGRQMLRKLGACAVLAPDTEAGGWGLGWGLRVGWVLGAVLVLLGSLCWWISFFRS